MLKHGASDASLGSGSSETPDGKKTLRRRDTGEEAIFRIDKKLDFLPEEIRYTATDEEDGVSITDLVATAIKKHRSKSQYLRSDFWTTLIHKCKLSSISATNLPMPEDMSDIRDTLLDALHIARSSNPAEKSAEPLTLFLEMNSDLSRAEIFAIVQASVEDELMIRRISMAMLAAL